MAQVLPYKAVIISKAILFQRTSFLTRDISEFSKDRHCWLSLKACWVNLVMGSMCAIMSYRTMEGTMIVAK